MIDRIVGLPGIRGLLSRLPWLPSSIRVQYDIWWGAPSYGYGMQSAARLAKSLGIPRVTAMEWGVVQGDRLVQLERIAPIVSQYFGIGVDIVAFDTGKGLPAPVDFRDCPHIWGEGFYAMDVSRVRSRLSIADLVLGEVGTSITSFLDSSRVAPVGFVACNLDYYSLATEALEALASAPQEKRLPRLLILFDDVLYPERACHNEWVGELRAINEFNDRHEFLKIAPLRWLDWMRSGPAHWHAMTYVLHDFSHPLYQVLITPEGIQHRQV
jgi:hypothetical protein